MRSPQLIILEISFVPNYAKEVLFFFFAGLSVFFMGSIELVIKVKNAKLEILIYL